MVSMILNNVRETLIVFQVNYAESAIFSKEYICFKHAFDIFHLIHCSIFNLDAATIDVQNCVF